VGRVEDLFLKDGSFEVGGVDLRSILEFHCTPLYVYSADLVKQAFNELRRLFPDFDIIFSLKANPGLAICSVLRSLGAGADVSSLGELLAALRAGFDPDDMFFVGPGKKEEEIAFAVGSGVYSVIAESVRDLEIVSRHASRLSTRQRVLLRINTSESPGSPEVMVGGPSKFGFDEEKVVDTVGDLDLPNVDIRGIHVYSASQVLDADFICGHIEYVIKAALRISREMGFPLDCIDLGGGFGVPYREGERELDLHRIAKKAQEVVGASGTAIQGCRLVFELGRYLVARSGVFLTRVLEVKESRGKRFLITDGGMNAFSRPVFMNVQHPVRIVNKLSEPASLEYDVCGPICTPIDCLARDVLLPEAEPGDTVGLFNAGAYGYTMSLMNFMSLEWPAEVIVDKGLIHLVRKERAAESFFRDQTIPGSFDLP
jgi:diaminopimelate decarboxylase